MEKVICKECGEELELSVDNFHRNNANKSGFNGRCKNCKKTYNKKYQQENRDKISTSRKGYLNEYRKKNKDKARSGQKKYLTLYAKYSTYGHQLFADDVRELENNMLEVKCKQCGKLFRPTNMQVNSRIASTNGVVRGENHFYCSEECKDNCDIFGKHPLLLKKQDELNAGIYTVNKHEGFYTDNELRVWSKQVRDNADSKCEICGQTYDLRAHHMLPKSEYPEQALDPANGVCLCDKCHYEKGHSQNGCKTRQLRKCEVKNVSEV